MASQVKTEIKIPEDLSPKEREVLGDLVIERIYERTTSENKDRFGKKFPKYSESYTKSLDFKIAGKRKGDVNLQLSGDMLAAMKLLKHKNGSLVIGFERGAEENGRAEGNILGTYGSDTPDKSKARDFLGVTEAELKKLIKYVRSK